MHITIPTGTTKKTKTQLKNQQVTQKKAVNDERNVKGNIQKTNNKMADVSPII